MGALTHNGEIMQSLPANASQINFDKTGTDLNSTQTENAIKEVNEKVNTNAEDITQLKSGLIDKHGVYEYNLLVTLAEFDGVSSYGAYLTSAYNALQSYINNLPNGVLIHIDRMNIGDMAINNPSSRLGNNTNTVGSSLFAQFIASDIANGHSVIRKVDAIGKTYEMIDDGVYSDLTSNVPAAGGTISVNVTLYALLS